ncbi:MAG: lipoyl synthase [SAR324 cluster bacterium]|jgi:lipoic acid synthetase|nr:lipoyl synthase [SAR324 cluster bacterium]|tara:strand:- start:356 stop:1255 length:900 start_codon:yes stop_codon:yes gene_type:complete
MTTAPAKCYSKKPPWLKVPFPGGDRYSWIKSRSTRLNLSTVCEEANCPNIGECWNGGTATFMLIGDTCTRGCRFCAVKSAKYPPAPDADEPSKLAGTIKKMNLNYVVLTTVNRDDLPDQGASHISRCIKATQKTSHRLLIEMLMPDFRGEKELIQKIIDASPAVLAHNLETVRRLTPEVRDYRADYEQSLEVLRYLKTNCPKGYTKSSLMLGLGESRREILQAMEDMRDAGVDFLTIGQYLQPTRKHLKVVKFLHPDEFNELGQIGDKLGFGYVASGPLVRSSYKASEFYIERKIRGTA